MEKETHTAATPTDRANAEAVRLWGACRYEEAARLLEDFLAAGRRLTAVEQLRTRNNLAMFARARGDFEGAARIHAEAEPFADACRDPLVRGKFHNGRALTHMNLGRPDEAIIEFTAASVYHEQAGEWALKREVENNLAVLHAEAGRVGEALEHVALALRSGPADEAARAQMEDTRALVALAAGDARAALDFSNSSVRRLLALDEPRLLAASVKTSVRAGGAYLRIEEEKSIRAVLTSCGWSLTRAYPLLGFNSRQALQHHLRRHFARLYAERRNRSVA